MKCYRLKLYPDDFERPYFMLRANVIMERHYVLHDIWFIVDTGFRISTPPESICEDRASIKIPYEKCIDLLKCEAYVAINIEDLVKGLMEYRELKEKGLNIEKKGMHLIYAC